MKRRVLIALEILLLLFSILVFRSVWLLMDGVPYLSRGGSLVVFLVIGLLGTVLTLMKLNKK